MQQENTTDPTLPNFIEPSLEEQMARQDEEQAIVDKIFQETRIKTTPNDPAIQLMLTIKNTTKENLDSCLSDIKQQLEQQNQKMFLELEKNQKSVIDEFDNKLEELKDILEALENQKETIIADVWGKLHVKVSEQIEQQLSKDLQTIANNANNKINNQRNILVGSVFGIIFGIVICVFIAFIFRN